MHMQVVFTLGLGAIVLLAVLPYVFGEWLGRRRAARESKAEIAALHDEIRRLRAVLGGVEASPGDPGKGLRRIFQRE